MRNRVLLFVVILFCLPLCAAGCSHASEAPKATAVPTVSPIASDMPSPEPTPITVNGCAAENGVLRAVVNADDFALIEQMRLHSLDVSGSVCYPEILAYCAAHPEVDVLYTVAIGDDVLSNHDVSATVKDVPDASLLSYLPALSDLTVKNPLSCEQAAALINVLPDASLTYSVEFAGLAVNSDADALDLSDVSPERADALAEGIAVLPKITDVQLNRADGSSDWTLEQAGILQAVRPTLRVDLNVTAFGVHFSLTDEVVSFNRKYLASRKDELIALLPYLRSVGRLDMEECGLSDEEMAALREQFPSPKIVWRVHVGPYECRTDAIMIHFSNFVRYPMLRDQNTHALIYCNEVKYLDLGHNLIQDPYFVAYMPNLEVCIIAIHQPTDISAFANCPHLEYAELFNGSVTDVSALANCTELKHLNLCMNQITDITPLYGLKKLERLWIAQNPIPQEQIDRFCELVPNCVVNTTAEDPTLNEWRWDYSRPSRYSERYELLRSQFLYGTGATSYTEEPDPD